MTQTKQLRIDFNNKFPNKFLFPIEIKMKELLDKNDIQQIFMPANLKYSDNKEFHSLLNHLLDALEQLPFRPDLAFDAVWKALDKEFFKVKEASTQPQHMSRFEVFQKEIVSDINTCQAFILLITIVPAQTCEFIVKRIFVDYDNNQDENSKIFLRRVKKCFGESLYSELINKYKTNWDSKADVTQRNVGRFILKLIKGEELDINGNKYKLTDEQKIMLLISVIMPQFRNERFHGATFPPFRSSKASIKTYAHAYFLFLFAYALLLEVFLYREFNVIEQADVVLSVENNKILFLKIFASFLEK